MKKINVVLLRGLIGNVYSRGMDTLGAKLAKLPGVDYVTVEDYTSWRSVRDRIAKWKDPTVIGGHSFGSNAATVIANALPNVKIPLILSVDPSQYWSFWLFRFGPMAVPPNVAATLNQYQSRDAVIGNVRLSGRNVQNVLVNSSHIDIDDLPLVHDAAIAEVKKIIGA